MKFYDYDEIKAAGDCLAFAKELGLPVNAEGRCPATWRGGTNDTSVSINKDGWHDFATEESGSIIDLCALVKFHLKDTMKAQEFLGERYGLKAKGQTRPHAGLNELHERLLADGFQQIAEYHYRNLLEEIVHTVIRMEKALPDGGKKKEFLQKTPRHWGLSGVTTILYNLANVVKADWALVVEGEKDADRLISLELPATTCCGGAKKWNDSYSDALAGKDVVILRDNDAPGLEHAEMVAASLLGKARRVKIINPSDLPKGDVSDYLDAGHSVEELRALIHDAPEIKPADLALLGDASAVREAKEANALPFRNFVPTKVQIGERFKIEKQPRQINELITDVHRRFIGFPRKVGEQLFDHDRDSGRICQIYRQASLFAWIQRKSKQKVEWNNNEGCASRDELYEGLLSDARRYEAISHVPDWPRRDDVYYAHPALPKPCPEHSRFEGFVNFFAPADDSSRVFLKAFVCAPLYYIRGIPRPLWIIDSEDGPGTGKTTIVECVANLYSGAPISTSAAELKKNFNELTKRIVSNEGRQARVLLLDNVTGTFSCSELADLVTKQDISGRSPWGRGEETRPNNLTYVITANSANIDNDLAARAYYILVKRPEWRADWKKAVMAYVEKHRLEIFADIVDILGAHKAFELPPSTRCPEFETCVLQAHCPDVEAYSQAIKMLLDQKTESNVEEEQAKRIEETIRFGLLEIDATPLVNPDLHRVFIRTEVVEDWLEKAGLGGWNAMQTIRNLAKLELLPAINKKVRRWPHHGKDRRSGVLWEPLGNMPQDATARIIGKTGNRKIGEVFL